MHLRLITEFQGRDGKVDLLELELMTAFGSKSYETNESAQSGYIRHSHLNFSIWSDLHLPSSYSQSGTFKDSARPHSLVSSEGQSSTGPPSKILTSLLERASHSQTNFLSMLATKDLLNLRVDPSSILCFDPKASAQFKRSTQDQNALETFTNWEFAVPEPSQHTYDQEIRHFIFNPNSKMEEDLMVLGSQHGLMEETEEAREDEVVLALEECSRCPYLQEQSDNNADENTEKLERLKIGSILVKGGKKVESQSSKARVNFSSPPTPSTISFLKDGQLSPKMASSSISTSKQPQLPSDLLSSKAPITSIPIPSRPVRSSYLQTIAFGILFNSCIIFANLTQFLILPLIVLPSTRPYYESLISYTKLTFGRTLVLISQLFGPTKLILSWEDQDGITLDPELFITRDKKGNVVKISHPQRSVWMSNHQVYTDWLYLWCVAYYSDLADSILIILKASLKHIPFVGWGMQFYRFIFLARSWAADKTYLGRHLSFMTARSRQTSPSGPTSSLPKLLLLIFPEGTLISENTQPISRKYAEKNGLEDRTNVLLPRSTGLLFCLRALRREVDDLKLVDFTIGYPGVPPAGYGQSFYTLRSIFMQGDPPPAVHIRCTVTSVDTSPSTSTSISSPPPLGILPKLKPGESDSAEATNEEKEIFDKWLQKRWAHKDSLMEKFYKDGDFNDGEFSRSESAGEYRRKGQFVRKDGDGSLKGKKGFVEVPVRLRSNLEIGDALTWAAPVWVGVAVAWAWKAWNK